MERLEKQLEGEEAKYRRLEEDHNRSKQERSHLSATEDDLRKREKNYTARIEELERELETKNDLVGVFVLMLFSIEEVKSTFALARLDLSISELFIFMLMFPEKVVNLARVG